MSSVNHICVYSDLWWYKKHQKVSVTLQWGCVFVGGTKLHFYILQFFFLENSYKLYCIARTQASWISSV